MEVPRPGAALRAPRFRLGLQADHPGAALVSDPAAADHADLYGHFRPDRQPADRRPAAVFVLHVGDRGLGLFRRVPEQDLQHFCAKRQPVRQGLLPAHGGAGLDFALEPGHFPDPVWHVPGLRGLFRAERDADRAQLAVDRAFAAVDGDDGRPGTGFRDHHLFADHQVPRPALFGAVWGAAADVRHTGHLPGFVDPRALPVDHPGQPDDPHRGGFSLCLPRGGHGRSRPFVV